MCRDKHAARRCPMLLHKLRLCAGAASFILALSPAAGADCPIDHPKLAAALKASVKASGGPAHGGFWKQKRGRTRGGGWVFFGVGVFGEQPGGPGGRRPGNFPA